MSDLGNWSAAAASVNNTLALASGTAGTSTIDGVAGVFSAADIARSRLLYFSSLPAVQATLAQMPFVAIGMLTLAIGILALMNTRLNRALLDILVAGFAALAASIFALANLVSCEKMPTPNRGLSITTAAVLALVLAFKLFYILRLSDQPGRNEVPQFLAFQEEEPKEGGPVSSDDRHLLPTTKRTSKWQNFIAQPGAGTYIHSGVWARYGLFGKVTRSMLYITIFTIMILDLLWRVGFINGGAQNFLKTYKASAGMQLIILLILGAHLLAQACSALQPTTAASNLLFMAPVLLGILVAIAVAITELAIVNFEDTPLGRLLVAVELFAFLVHAFSSELKHPYRDSFSFEPSRTVPRDSEGRMGYLPTLSVSTFRATPPNMRNSQRSMRNGLQPSSSVYTGPVIRRGSHAPSWESEVLRTGKYASLPDRASIVSEKSSQLKEDVDVLNTSLESFPEPESPMDVEPQRRGHRRIATRDLPPLTIPTRVASRSILRQGTSTTPAPPYRDLRRAASDLRKSVSFRRKPSDDSQRTQKSERPSVTLSVQSNVSDLTISNFPMPPSGKASDTDGGSLYRFSALQEEAPVPSYRTQTAPRIPEPVAIRVDAADFDLLPPRMPAAHEDQRRLSEISFSSAASLGMEPPASLNSSLTRDITSFIATQHRRGPSDSTNGARGIVAAPPSPAPSVLSAQIVACTRVPSGMPKSEAVSPQPQAVVVGRSLPSSPKDVRSRAAVEPVPAPAAPRRGPVVSQDYFERPRPAPRGPRAPASEANDSDTAMEASPTQGPKRTRPKKAPALADIKIIKPT